MPAVAIINTEEGAFGPVLMLAVLWLHDVQDDGDTVLVVASDQALVSVGRVSSHYAIPSQAALGGFVIGYNDSCSWLKRKLLCVFILSFNGGVLVKHLRYIKSCEGLNLCLASCLRIQFLSNSNVFLVLFKECFEIKFGTTAISSNTRGRRSRDRLSLWQWTVQALRFPLIRSISTMQ